MTVYDRVWPLQITHCSDIEVYSVVVIWYVSCFIKTFNHIKDLLAAVISLQHQPAGGAPDSKKKQNKKLDLAFFTDVKNSRELPCFIWQLTNAQILHRYDAMNFCPYSTFACINFSHIEYEHGFPASDFMLRPPRCSLDILLIVKYSEFSRPFYLKW